MARPCRLTAECRFHHGASCTRDSEPNKESNGSQLFRMMMSFDLDYQHALRQAIVFSIFCEESLVRDIIDTNDTNDILASLG